MLSDVLMHSKLSSVVRFLCRDDIAIVPEAYYINRSQYKIPLKTIGFHTIDLVDVKDETYEPFCHEFLRAAARSYFDWKPWPGVFTREFPLPLLYLFLTAQRSWLSDYLLVDAQESSSKT